MKLKIKEDFCFKLIIWSIFIFNYAIREKFIPVIKDFNILFFLALFLLILKNKKNISIKSVFGILILLIYCIFVNYVTGSRINNVVYFIINTIMPLLLLAIKEKNNNKSLNIELIRKIVNCYNLFIIIFFVIFLLDFITGNLASNFLASNFTLYNTGWIGTSIINNRYHFFFAHPLTSSAIVMVYYLLNIICNKYKIKTNTSYWIFHIISFSLMLSFGSKTAIIIFIILFYIYNFTYKKIVGGIIIFLTTYFTGSFDYIINRFLNDKSLTSGRNEALSKIIPNFIDIKSIFTGKGENLQYIITNQIGLLESGASQEYPIIVYFLRYGLIFTIILLNYLLFNPIKECISTKNYFLIIPIIAIFTELSMYNGLTSLVEVEILYVMFLMIIRIINSLNKDVITI